MLGKVGTHGQVPAPIGLQVCQPLENGEVCQAPMHTEFGKVPPDLTQNPSKDELDASWDRYQNEPDERVFL